MAGCFGNSFEDRYRERELNRYLEEAAERVAGIEADFLRDMATERRNRK